MKNGIYENGKLSGHEMHRLSRSPQYKPRVLVMTAIGGVFFLGPVVYFAIVASGAVTPPTPPPQGFPVWPFLALVALGQIPAQVLFVTKTLKEARANAGDFDEASGRALTILVVALSFAESTCLYGLVSIVLHAPRSFAYGLMTLGVVHLILTVAIVWPRLKMLMLTRLAAEERETGGHW